MHGAKSSSHSIELDRSRQPQLRDSGIIDESVKMGAFRMNRISESIHIAKRGEVSLEEPGGSSGLFDGMDNGRSA